MPTPIPVQIVYMEKRNPDANESKFWALRFVPSTKPYCTAFRVWWGRIGTRGGSKVFDDFATATGAIQDANTRAAEKRREGYVPVTSTDWTPEFLKEEGRAPSIPISRNEDGWPIVNGKPQRPDGRGTRETPKPSLGEFIDEMMALPPMSLPPQTRPKRSIVEAVLSTVRVIDLDD